MKKTFTKLFAALALLAFFIPSFTAMGQVVSGITYSTPNTNNLPTGWSGSDGGGTSYIKLTASNNYIQTSSFEQNGFTSIKLKARKFGGPSDAQALITVSWYNNNTETVLGTITPSNTNLVDYIISSPTNPTGNTTGYIKIQCKGASNSKGSGVSEVTITYTAAGGQQPTTYNVTVTQATGGTITANPTQATAGTTINLTATPDENYTFSQWVITPSVTVNNNQFTMPANDVSVTASWTENTAQSGTTATFNIQSYASANDWSNGVQYTSATVDQVTFTANGGSNTGKYYTNGNEWRYYQGESASITISVPQGYTLVNVKPTYNISNSGVLKNGGNSISSGSTVNVSGTSVTFTVGNSGSATNGQVKFTNIDVTYVADGGSQSQSDLAITGAPVALSFDLYNNSSAQTVSYTTSSIGAITIEPASPTSYFSYVHDATNKTITVTPLAVTPSAQTVTINQAADDDYYAGTASFTVSVVNSAPLTTIAALTAQTAGEYTVTLTDALVTYTNGTSAYLEDASGAVLLYHCNDNNLNLAVGDKITGTANVTYTVYNNLPEVTAFTLATGYTLTSGNTVTPAVVTIADLENNYTSYISRYVKIENATVTSAFSNKNCTIEQNSSSIVLRDQNSSATLTSNVGDHVTVTAHPSIYSTTHQIAVYEQSQIVVAKVDPTITFNNGSVRVGQTLDLSTLFTSNSNGAVTYSITAGGSYATLSGSELTGTAEGSVTVKAVQAETTSYNEGEATATITVNPALVLSSIAVTTAPTKTTYNEGETFDPTGMVVTATYTDNSTNAVTGYTYLPDGALATTDTEITISYTENNVTKTTTQAITVNEVVDYAMLPFEFNGGKADIENTVGLTQNGLGSDYNSSPKLKFDGTGDYVVLKINERPGTLSFYLKGNGFSQGSTSTFTVQTSTNGTDYSALEQYTSITDGTKTFDNLNENTRYIRWIYTEKGSSNGGNVALGNINLAAYEASTNTAPVWSALPTPTIAINAEYELDLSTYVTGVPTPTISISTSVSSNLYEFVDGLFMFQPTAAGTYEFTFTATNTEGSAGTTLTVTAVAATTYTLATSIENGRHYIITNGTDQAMGAQSTNNRSAVAVTIENGVATVTGNDVYEVVINGPDANSVYTIYDAAESGYLYAAGGTSSNHMKTQTFCDNKGQWNISFDGDAANIVANFSGNNARNTMRYNDGNDIFSCYVTGTQTAIYLYVKEETIPQYDFYMDIAAWNVTQTAGTNKTDGWYFIASPLVSAYTLTETDMVSGTYEDYDLYRLNNTTWENYNQHSDFTALNNGTGYLYANSSNITLHFSGAINTFTTEGGANVKSLSEGWNLIGNPYNVPIYINKPYYKMNADGNEVEAGYTSTAIPACTGVIVKATGDSESVTFSTTAPEGANNGGNIQMSVLKNNVRGNDVQDKAIISFNEGSKLEKFQLFEGNAKLYIPQNGEDYAIAFSNRQGDMPLNFKTTEAGMYTISFEGDNMDLKGVSLIDMLAEEEIDLSVDPSYTFIGSPADKAERFKIVFSPSTGSGADIFAYQSGSDIIVSGEGELQIFDVMGRKVKTQYVSGVQTVNVNAQGVYIMKLNEKTQKIIVR